MEGFKFVSKNKVSQLPKSAGVYCFKANGKILYIGKAANIQERVKNHFQESSYRDGFFMNKVKKVGYFKTDSEFAEPSVHLTSHPTSRGSEIEALILEANLIKKYQPKYNIVWRDDKNYFYVAITKEDLPRVLIVHQKREKAEYLGPFVEGTSLKRTLTFLRRAFPYYTAKKHPKTGCLWCSLKLCPGPNPDKKDYQKNIRNLITVLKGKSKNALKNLKKEMKRASTGQNYERAAKIRDQLRVLEKVILHARVLEPAFLTEKKKLPLPFQRVEAYDISNIQGQEATGSLVTFIDGYPEKNLYRKFKIKIEGKPNDVAMIKEVLKRRLKHQEWPLPDLILIDGGKPQLNAAKSVVKNKVKVMAIAKKKNELYVEGKKKPMLLKTLPREIFNLILQLRDEAHRFAISYHRRLRKRVLLEE